jgi:hypothetical protein
MIANSETISVYGEIGFVRRNTDWRQIGFVWSICPARQIGFVWSTRPAAKLGLFGRSALVAKLGLFGRTVVVAELGLFGRSALSDGLTCSERLPSGQSDRDRSVRVPRVWSGLQKEQANSFGHTRSNSCCDHRDLRAIREKYRVSEGRRPVIRKESARRV